VLPMVLLTRAGDWVQVPHRRQSVVLELLLLRRIRPRLVDRLVTSGEAFLQLPLCAAWITIIDRLTFISERNQPARRNLILQPRRNKLDQPTLAAWKWLGRFAKAERERRVFETQTGYATPCLEAVHGPHLPELSAQKFSSSSRSCSSCAISHLSKVSIAETRTGVL